MPDDPNKGAVAPTPAKPGQPAPPHVAPAPGGHPQPVTVIGTPQTQPGAPPEPDPKSPYTGPSEIVEGGRYMRKTKFLKGQHHGGEIVNAHGEQLAWFKDDEVNTGDPADGHKPDADAEEEARSHPGK